MHDAPARLEVPARTGPALRLLRGIAAAGLTVMLLGALAPLRPAAQEAGTFSIVTTPTVTAIAGTEVALPIQVAPPDTVPQGAFVTLRGLPPAVALKDGHAVGAGRWAVPLSALPSLVAQIPDGLSGRSEIIISLIARDGRLLAQDKTALVVRPSSLAEAEADAAPASMPAAAEPSAEERARAERMLARGEAYLANGNIMAARDFFARAAGAGLAAAALRLASTYDPVVLERLETQGVAPDVALARRWYERARDLGAADAAEPLARLARQ